MGPFIVITVLAAVIVGSVVLYRNMTRQRREIQGVVKARGGKRGIEVAVRDSFGLPDGSMAIWIERPGTYVFVHGTQEWVLPMKQITALNIANEGAVMGSGRRVLVTIAYVGSDGKPSTIVFTTLDQNAFLIVRDWQKNFGRRMASGENAKLL